LYLKEDKERQKEVGGIFWVVGNLTSNENNDDEKMENKNGVSPFEDKTGKNERMKEPICALSGHFMTKKYQNRRAVS
jgi:hypothetical protein